MYLPELIHVRVHVWVQVHVCACVWRTEVDFITFYLIYWGKVSVSLNPEQAVLAGQGIHFAMEIPYLRLSHTGIPEPDAMSTWIFTWVLEIQTQTLTYMKHHLTPDLMLQRRLVSKIKLETMNMFRKQNMLILFKEYH